MSRSTFFIEKSNEKSVENPPNFYRLNVASARLVLLQHTAGQFRAKNVSSFIQKCRGYTLGLKRAFSVENEVRKLVLKKLRESSQRSPKAGF